MSHTSNTIIAVNIISHKGKRLIHEDWMRFVNFLHAGLQQYGRLNPDSTENLFIFNYNHPYTALASCIESITKAKKQVAWNKELGMVPVQIIVHLDNPAEPYTEMLDVSASIWNFLKHESFYLTRSLKSQWNQLMDGKALPPAGFRDETGGVYLLKFSEPPQIKVERLFPHRGLATADFGKECFYCCRTDHFPADCPSKLLGMETQGLPFVGYMPFQEISNIYQDVFSNPGDISTRLVAGLKPGEIKREPSLQVYTTYFDINRVFQPRFLHHITFTLYKKWEEIGKLDKIRIDNNMLHMGYDCLRVQNYSKAQKWLSSDSLRSMGKEFYSLVGLAFLALEQGRDKDMGTLLEHAGSLAAKEIDYIYVGLLLFRYYYLNNDLWKAEQELNNILTIHNECTEAKFGKIKLGLKTGFIEQAYSMVDPLIKESRDCFMMALMDPSLKPIQGLVEEVLSAHYQNLNGIAKKALAEVNKEWSALNDWLGENGVADDAIEKSVKALRMHLERGTYYDLLKVCGRAKAVVASCHRNRRELLEHLENRITECLQVWEKYQLFWENYPYHALFTDFLQKLNYVNNRLGNIQMEIKNDKKLLYSEVEAKIEKISSDIENFKPQVGKMVWIREAIIVLKSFLRRLFIYELVVNVIVYTALAFLTTVAADLFPANLLGYISKAWFQNKIHMISSLMVAPLIALSIIVWEKSNGQIKQYDGMFTTTKILKFFTGLKPKNKRKK